MTAGIALTVAIRYLLVALFLPFSALDKILNFRGAVAQAREVVPAEGLARLLIVGGLCIEIVMPLAILCGYGDRLAAIIMAGYCCATAILWKRFWEPGDFWRPGASRGRDLFWDFLKNLALAGGFLLVTFGTTARDAERQLDRPQFSTHPYARHDAMKSEHEPSVAYWHLWTDERGVSRQRRCAFTQFERRSISEPASPQWIGREAHAAVTTLVTVLPVGWVGEWHENPRPQWIIPLSGRWFVESMDGQRVEMGPGELSLGADQGTREMQGRKGHLSGTVGDEPAVLWLIQYDEAPPAFS